MNLLLITSHSIAEYDDLRMFSDAGLDVFSIGAYSDPAHPGDDKRPALPDAPAHPELVALCEEQRERHPEPFLASGVPAIDWAKADLAQGVIDWADAIVLHHFPERWLIPQWPRLRDKRVIWRTCGQSTPDLEAAMRHLADDGLRIVRYSPREREAFPFLGAFAGEDALIRFGKYPADYGPWIGDEPVVGNVTQDMVGRAGACGLFYYLEATEALPAKPAGPGSEYLPGGIGALAYPAMLEYLRHLGAYLYTGTSPASYTLGLIEAMLSGVPTVSVGHSDFGVPELFEGDAIVGIWGTDATRSRALLAELLRSRDVALAESERVHQRAVALFDVATVTPQWLEVLA